MKRFWLYGVLPSVIIYIIVGMIDVYAGVCTDRVLFALIFNSVFILPVCCVISTFKSNADVKNCFLTGLIITALLPCMELCIYLSALGFEITLTEAVFLELFFTIASYLIIIPGTILVLYKKGKYSKKIVKTILSCLLSVVLLAEAVLGVSLMISADEWQAPYEKYEISGGFSPEVEGYYPLETINGKDGTVSVYEKKLRGGRMVYCKVYTNSTGDGVTVEKWGHGTD